MARDSTRLWMLHEGECRLKHFDPFRKGMSCVSSALWQAQQTALMLIGSSSDPRTHSPLFSCLRCVMSHYAIKISAEHNRGLKCESKPFSSHFPLINFDLWTQNKKSSKQHEEFWIFRISSSRSQLAFLSTLRLPHKNSFKSQILRQSGIYPRYTFSIE